MKLDFTQILPSVPFIMEGVFITLKYTIISLCFGFVLGTILSLMKISSSKILKGFSRFYTSVFQGTPLLVQLMLIYYCTPQLLNYNISAFEAGIIAFSLNSAAYISELIRTGIKSVDWGQFEAFRSLGISYKDGIKDVILPQALRNILPALINEMINLLKESSIISIIGEMDLIRRADIVAAEKYIYFEPLLLVAATYYIMVLVLTAFAKRVEKWMARSDRY